MTFYSVVRMLFRQECYAAGTLRLSDMGSGVIWLRKQMARVCINQDIASLSTSALMISDVASSALVRLFIDLL
eukprot:362749-Chlamydomonas_euryale.AAC.10